MNIPRAIRDEIYVKVRQVKETKIKYKSLELDIDPDFKPWEHSVTYGTVVTVPLKRHSYHYFHSRVQHTVMPGDKIYFHYNTLLTAENEVDIPGTGLKEVYYRVPYEGVFCRINPLGEPEMIGGRILVDPVIDTENDIVKLDDGRMAKIINGIVFSVNVKHSTLRGIVRYAGPPLEGEPEFEPKPGDMILFQKDADMSVKIEGKEYFCMLQEDVVAIEDQ